MGNTVRMVDPSSSDKADFLAMAVQHKPDTPFEFPLHVVCAFIFPRPKGHYRTGKNAHLLKDSAPYFHTGTPDVDNLTKFVGDALNGIFWKDDCFIVRLEGVKAYANYGSPRVEVAVYDVKPLNLLWLEVHNG
jgi:Holliday junction resolvase RusA-like endonuclease